jgi:pimeloyl-ACP methyl ester carboxylesterase
MRRKPLSHIPIVARLIALSLLLSLAGCGGGGGGTAPAGPALLSSVSRAVDTTGDTLVAPNVGVSAQFPQNSLTTATTVTLKVFDTMALPLANPNLEANSNTIDLSFDTGVLAAKGTIKVTAPYTTAVDPQVDVVVMGDNQSNYLAVMPTFDTNAKTFTFTLMQADFNVFFPPSSRQTRSLISDIYFKLTHFISIPHRDYRDFYKYDGTQLNLSTNTTDDWSDSSKRYAVVIHGIFNHKDDMLTMVQYLAALPGAAPGSNLYDAVWAVDYNWQTNIADNATEVAKFIAHRVSGNRNHQVDIYGYSMGGLVARWAIEKAPLEDGTTGCGDCVGRLFTFGTPHVGVPLRALVTLLLFPGADALVYTLVPGVNDLADSGTFLQRLNDGSPSPYSGAISYYTFAGNRWPNYKGCVGTHCATNIIHSYYAQLDAHLGTHFQNEDGIVPVVSAQFSGLALKSSRWVHPTETYSLNHSDLKGAGSASNFNLDLDPVHRPLRSYIIPTGAVEVGVK